MMIVINPKGIIPDESWHFLRKVRAIVENDEGCIAITVEGGKCIFPGVKCEDDENELPAIKREITEELGIKLDDSDFHKILDLHTVYDDFFDFRSQSVKPRRTITTYYYVRTSQTIDQENINITDGEKEQGLKTFFVNRETLLNMLMADHSNCQNGKFFDDENLVIVEHVLKKQISKNKL